MNVYPAYISKHNSYHKKQLKHDTQKIICSIMVNNIKTRCDSHSLNCLHSLIIKNKLESHEIMQYK